MLTQIIRLLFAFILGFSMTGCVSAKKQLYYEPAVERQAVRFKRVAIVPNRLPLNLNDPEKWRKFNWELVADVIVIPYYGTSATTKNFFLFTSMKWEAIVTFQFFFKDRNEFLTRMDATGTDSYVSGLLMLPGLVLISADPAVGGLISLTGALIDLSQTLFRTSDSHWRSAFRTAINDGLTAFLETYPSYAEGPQKKQDREIEKLFEPAETTTTKLPNFRATFPDLDKYSDEQILAAYRQKFSKFNDVGDLELINLIEAKYGSKK